MRTRRSRHIFVAVLMTFSLAAAACSSGGNGSNNATDIGSDDTDFPDDFGGGSGSGDGITGFGSKDCRQLVEAFSDAASANDADSLQETADLYYAAADQAPAEIADDLEVLADLLAAASDDPLEFGAAILDDEYIEATTNLTVWIAENCAGIDIDG